MKKLLVLLIVGTLLAACEKSNEHTELHIPGEYSLEYFGYSLCVNVVNSGGTTSYINTLCRGGDSEYCWLSQELPEKGRKSLRLFNYVSLSDLSEDLWKLANHSYDANTIVKYKFNWEDSDETNEVKLLSVGTEDMAIIIFDGSSVTVPKKFLQNAEKYIEKYSELN